MDTLASPYLDLLNADATDPTMFLFMSGHRKVRTSGVIEQISEPARDGTRKDSLLQQAISHAFKQARKSGQKNPIVIGAIPFDVSQPCYLTVPEWYELLPHLAVKTEQTAKIAPIPVVRTRSIPDQAGFQQIVSEAVSKFRQGQLQKAVLSRILELDLNETPDCNVILNNLMIQNPSAYQFRIPLGNNSTLIGASPELLVRKEKNTIYSNPLAGTSKRQSDPEQDRLSSQQLLESQKDQYEHRLVIETIRGQLSPICDELEIPQHPSLIHTSTLWHLSTQIHGRLRHTDTNALQVACLLHPTPALCGSPTHLAKSLIDQLEPHDRGLFSGIVGWCDSEGNGEWAITIRCGIIQQNMVRLFAGAGIVANSDPASEWKETADKLGTMLNAFNICSEV